jgi:hypothetical protein
MSVGKRISVVLSILWALLIISIANSNYKFDWNLVLFGLVALVFFWGGYWVYLGVKSGHNNEVLKKDVSKQDNVSFSDSPHDAEYEAKLKHFGLKNNDAISLKLLVYLSAISLAIGIGMALTASGMKQFDLASSIGYNLPISGLVTWGYCYSNKIRFRSKHGGLAFVVAYITLIVAHAIALN